MFKFGQPTHLTDAAWASFSSRRSSWSLKPVWLAWSFWPICLLRVAWPVLLPLWLSRPRLVWLAIWNHKKSMDLTPCLTLSSNKAATLDFLIKQINRFVILTKFVKWKCKFLEQTTYYYFVININNYPALHLWRRPESNNLPKFWAVFPYFLLKFVSKSRD